MQGDEEEFTVEIRDAPPEHLLLDIESFSKFAKYGNQAHESREFNAGDYNWKLVIYPNGRDCKDEGDHISVYLCVTDTDNLPHGWEVKASCSIFLRNQISNNYFCYQGKERRFDGTKSKWGFSISKRMLANGYLVHDNCAFGAEVFLSKPHCAAIKEYLAVVDWKITGFSKLKDIWYSEEFVVGGLQWRIKLYPNGSERRDAKGKSVSIYLECVEAKIFAPSEEVKADCCIRIKNKLPHAHCSKHLTHLFRSSAEGGWGWADFIPITDMCDPSKGFVVDDCCFLEIKLSLNDVVYNPK